MPESEDAPTLAVGGVTPLTTVDFPGRLAAVVFCQGCPWRCPYCHNPHLRPCRTEGPVRWEDVRAFLKTRVGLLDGVVFSGGEPLVQAGLGRAMADVRAMGFQVALHTGGCDPQGLRRALDSVEWVGFDVKAPFADYARVTGMPGSGEAAAESLAVLLAGRIAFEVRTTVDPSLFSARTIRLLAEELASLGVRRFVLQECRDRSGRALAAEWLRDPALGEFMTAAFPSFDVRFAA